MDEYDSGIRIVRVNLDTADPPEEVIDSFREVQAAEQERDRLQRQADAYANRVLAEARGEAAQILENSEGYRARVVNEARGDASRFTSVLTEYTERARSDAQASLPRNDGTGAWAISTRPSSTSPSPAVRAAKAMSCRTCR